MSPTEKDGQRPVVRPHPALPVRQRFTVEPGAEEEKRIRSLAAGLLRDDEALRADLAAVPAVRSGIQDGPGLVIHDISRTRPAGAGGRGLLEYRGLLLAADADTVVVGVRRSQAFEAHTRELLALDGAPVRRVQRTPGVSLAAAARRDDRLLEDLAGRAREAGRFTVRPYISNSEVWELAGEIGNRGDVQVLVEGPPPALSERVNDKLWFTKQVMAVLGQGSTPPAAPAESLDQLVDLLGALGGPHDRLAVRLRSAAAGEGNLVIPKEAIARSPAPAVEPMLRQFFGGLDPEDVFPLQVAVWEAPVFASPSVQTWIPRADDGPPIVEAVIDQWCEGEHGAFSGGVPSTLPDPVQQTLAREAGLLATLFQALGWLGRCSFDAILVESDAGRLAVHWVECNGRWGGASIPMTAAERLVGDWSEHPFLIVHRTSPTGRCIPAEKALNALDELLFHRGEAEGVLLLSPTSLETGQGLDLMAIAGDGDRAADLAAAAGDRILGAPRAPP
ncbi:MAG: hypothetical protein ACN0LA_10510 [Candidatus Longimicrobiales bacterium M2_2A_002]